MKKVAIVIYTTANYHPDFAICLTRMMVDMSLRGYVVQPLVVNGEHAHVARNQGAKIAIDKLNVDFVLFLDTSLTFPPDSVHHLVNQDKDIIGAGVVRNTTPIVINASDKGNRPIQLAKDQAGVIKVKRLGLGFLLVKREVFVRMPMPWFKVNLDDKYQWISDAENFSDRAVMMGYDILMDIDLSKNIANIGDYHFSIMDAMQWDKDNQARIQMVS